MPQKAIVLSAGKGTRMGEVSRRMPKPLVRVNGRTLLDRTLDHLAKAGVTAVVNVHHHADMIETHLADKIRSGQVMLSDERERLLETGGGIRKALPLLGDGLFFSINSDALWVDGTSPTLTRMAESFDADRMDALLLLVPTEEALGYDGTGDFFLGGTDGSGPLSFRGDRPHAPYMYGGIMLTDTGMYRDEDEGCWSNLRIFKKAASRGRLFGLVHTGHWMHIGTPDAITLAEHRLAGLGEPRAEG